MCDEEAEKGRSAMKTGRQDGEQSSIKGKEPRQQHGDRQKDRM
jgi:hypothetical protein